MGLDVYTYTKAEQDEARAWEAKHNDAWFEKATEDERTKAYQDMPSGGQSVKSQQYPDNINERRYLRSSYNGAGFNSYVPEVTRDEGNSYYGVFAPLGVDLDEYEIKVDSTERLLECRSNALKVVADLEAIIKDTTYKVESARAVSLRPDLYGTPTREQALALFDKERAENKGSPFGGGYSNALGQFFDDSTPLEVVGAIAGVDVLGSPCVHLIYKTMIHPSYLESAHVLVEFVDELLDLVKQDGVAYLHWSG